MIKRKMERGTKIIKTLLWKNVDIWKIVYAWITYVVPIFRYGALVFKIDEDAKNVWDQWKTHYN